MQRTILLLFSSYIIILNSCQQKEIRSSAPFYQKQNAALFLDSVTLVKTGTATFEIAENVPITSKSIELSTHGKERYYSSINIYNGELNIYDYDTKKHIKKVKLFNEGPNGVGHPEYITHHLKSLDSIYISNSWNSKFYIVNGDSRIIKQVQLPEPGSKKFIVGPGGGVHAPMQQVDNILYVTGNLYDLNIPDHTQVKNVITIDMDTSQPGRLFPRTELFNSGTWGAASCELYSTYNKKDRKFVYAWGGEPFLYETNHSAPRIKHYLGSKYVDKVVPFADEKFRNDNVDYAKFEKHDLVTPQYGKVIYDEFNDLYYRFLFIPLTEAEYVDPNRRVRKESVIISDRNFKKVGEVILPHKEYNTDMLFISKEGLHVAKIPALQASEQEIIYDIFKPQIR